MSLLKFNIQQGAVMEMPSLYTPNQVADYLHVSRGTIYSLISRNEIDSIKVGRNRRFTAQNIKDYLARRPQVVVSGY
jgi:excisionase family DNA binding protein